MLDQIKRNEPAKIREVIQYIFLKCHKIRILVTSSFPVGNLRDTSEKVHTLPPLNEINSKDLFLSRASRNITEQEIEELLNYELTEEERELLTDPDRNLDTRMSRGRTYSQNSFQKLLNPRNNQKENSFENHYLF